MLCEILERIYIPNSVLIIGDDAFEFCYNLTISTAFSSRPYTWQYKIFDMSFEDRFNPYGIAIFSDYEQAAIAGIEYTLDNLV